MRRQEGSWCFRISQENEKTAVSSCQLCEYVLITHDNFTDLGSPILHNFTWIFVHCPPLHGYGWRPSNRWNWLVSNSQKQKQPGLLGRWLKRGRRGFFWTGSVRRSLLSHSGNQWEPWRLCRDSTKMHKVCTDDLRTVTCAFCKSATIVAELSLSRIQTAKLPGLGTLVDLSACLQRQNGRCIFTKVLCNMFDKVFIRNKHTRAQLG